MSYLKLLRILVHPRMNARSYGVGKDPPPLKTFNDLRQPEGDYATLNAARQKRYLMRFVLGTGSFIATIAIIVAADLTDAYSDIPAEPLDIESYR